jgi:hypothetical protein
VSVSGPEKGGFDEEFVSSAAYKELAAFERVRAARRPLPPPPRRGRRRRLRRERRLGRRARLRRAQHRFRHWLVFATIAVAVILIQLPDVGLEPGRSSAVPSAVPAAARNEPSPSAPLSRTPLGAPQAHPDVPDGYVFMHTKRDGSPVAYDPCRAIPFVVNPRTAPPGGEALLHEAVARVSEVTGLHLRFEGHTDEAPVDDRPHFQPERYGDRWAPVLIAWTDPVGVPSLSGAAGMAGSTAISVMSPEPIVYVTGAVVLDGPDFGRMLSHPKGAAQARGVLLHELAHLLGLAHVDDPSQLMHPSGPQTELQVGDLAGLSRLGAGPCFRSL